MREAIFCTEVVNSIKAVGQSAYKIADTPIDRSSRRMRFAVNKPSDIVTNIEGHSAIIECKQLRKMRSIGLKEFRPSQIKALDEHSLKGPCAYAFVNLRFPRTSDFGQTNEALILDWRRWGPYLKSGKRITIDMLTGGEKPPFRFWWMSRKNYHVTEFKKIAGWDLADWMHIVSLGKVSSNWD